MRRNSGNLIIWLVAAPVFAAMVLAAQLGSGQTLGLGVPSGAGSTTNPLADTTMKPGKALLYDLEARFAKATADGGGKAFSSWFATDAVSLSKGEAPVEGRDAIARQASWLPKDYQLIWTPTDGVMSPAGDMGYTWGHYEGHSRDALGNPLITTGRYFTVWRKEPDGSWKVVLDSSSDEPAAGDACCTVPSAR